MKVRFILSIILSSAIVFFMISCNKDEETPPNQQSATLLFNPDPGTFTGIPGDSVKTQVSASAPDGLISVTIYKTVGNGSPSQFDELTPNAGENQLIFQFGYELQSSEIGEDVIFDFLVQDVNSDTAALKSFTVVTNSPPARSYTAVLLYVPLIDKSAESFFSTNTGAVYSPDSVNNSAETLSADIDFGYYYGVTDSASLASPLGYSQLNNTTLSSQVSGWNIRNDIVFRSTDMTESQFNELSGSATFADLDTAFAHGSDEGDIITHLDTGNVIAFATDENKEGGSKTGLIMVSEISGTYYENDYIKLEILVQEPAE